MPGLPAAVVASLVVVSAIDILSIYLPALGTERGLTASTVGWLLVLRAVATTASRWLLGAAVGRLGRSRLLVVGALAAGAALVVLALPVPLVVLVVANGRRRHRARRRAAADHVVGHPARPWAAAGHPSPSHRPLPVTRCPKRPARPAAEHHRRPGPDDVSPGRTGPG